MLPSGEKVHLDAEAAVSLDAVIATVDLLYPPEGWNVDDKDLWTRGSWTCRPTPSGWKVSTPGFEVKQHFMTCDRARKWVDLRVDRVGGIRGPRTRSAAVADRTLPDVRVTEAERAAALELAKVLGVSYSTFVRASLKLISHLAESGELRVAPRDPGDAEFSLPTLRAGLASRSEE
jgi:hypothetical protein